MVRSVSDPFRLAPLAATLWLAALTAQAQSAAPTAKADPLDPAARVPALTYESSFAQYRRLHDEKPAEPGKAWREANDTVARIGGWRAYAREAQQPDQATATRPVPADAAAAASAASGAGDGARTMPAGHGGHGGHKP